MSEAKITYINFYCGSNPSLSVTVQDKNYNSSSFQINGDELLEVQALLWTIIEKKKRTFAEQILQLEAPVALIGHEKNTLDLETPSRSLDDDIPF